MLNKITKYIAAQLLVFSCLITLSVSVQAQHPDQVYVLNQGAFLQGNASVTAYDPSTGEATQNIFAQANERPLGDVAVHSALINDLIYVLVSNSDKIEIVDPETFVAVETIFVDDFGGSSPQWIEQVSDTKAYVSNLTGNTVSILDLTSNEITGEIEVGPNPDGIAVSNGKAYVALTDFGEGNEVAVIDIATDQLLTVIEVHDNPQKLYADAMGRIWVVCTGDFGFGDGPETFGELNVIDAETDEVIGVIELGDRPQTMQIDNASMTAWVINEGIQVVDMETFEVDEFRLTETAYFALGFWDGDEPRLYATLAPDFSSSGSVDILSLDGEVVTSFTAGIGPGFVQFVGDDDHVSVNPPEVAAGFRLDQNYPNPFNPTTTIRFELPEATEVTLSVYDIMGRRVATLANGRHSAGTHTYTLDASGWSSGVYLYRIQTPSAVYSRSMTLVK